MLPNECLAWHLTQQATQQAIAISSQERRTDECLLLLADLRNPLLFMCMTITLHC
jgi:hypothetical protein